MRRLIVLTPAFALIAACGGSPIKQDSSSERTSEKASSISEDPALSPPQES